MLELLKLTLLASESALLQLVNLVVGWEQNKRRKVCGRKLELDRRVYPD
jgi:hypothetical protein